MNRHDITVCIPTIPPRAHLLNRALASVEQQTLSATSVIVEHDVVREGAAATRERALEQVTTEWVAFLDDDDEFKPGHLDCLVAAQQESGADYVYSWYELIGGIDPLPHFGKVFDHCNPTQTTITTLVRTELAKEAGFIHSDKFAPLPPDGNAIGEDWLFTLRVIELGGYIFHTPYRTWKWWHWGGNTSGRPDRWTDTPISLERVSSWANGTRNQPQPELQPQPEVVFPRIPMY